MTREKNRAAEQELTDFLTEDDDVERPDGPRHYGAAVPRIRHGRVLYVSVREGEREFTLSATVTDTGPEFELLPPMRWDEPKAETRVLTRDDAQFAHTFLSPTHVRDDLQQLVREVLEAEYVFEVGIEIPWEGMSRRKLFRQYVDAYRYAEELVREQQASYDDYDVIIVPVAIH